MKINIIKSNNKLFTCYKCSNTLFHLKYIRSYDDPIENNSGFQNLIIIGECALCKTKNGIPSNKVGEIKFIME